MLLCCQMCASFVSQSKVTVYVTQLNLLVPVHASLLICQDCFYRQKRSSSQLSHKNESLSGCLKLSPPHIRMKKMLLNKFKDQTEAFMRFILISIQLSSCVKFNHKSNNHRSKAMVPNLFTSEPSLLDHKLM